MYHMSKFIKIMLAISASLTVGPNHCCTSHKLIALMLSVVAVRSQSSVSSRQDCSLNIDLMPLQKTDAVSLLDVSSPHNWFNHNTTESDDTDTAIMNDADKKYIVVYPQLFNARMLDPDLIKTIGINDSAIIQKALDLDLPRLHELLWRQPDEQTDSLGS